MVYSTLRCPNCGQVIRKQTNPVKKIDVPFERCYFCGTTYRNSYKEEWITKSPVKRFLFFLQAGVWARAFAIPAILLAIPMLAFDIDTLIVCTLWLILSSVWLIAGYFIHKNAAQYDISLSLDRTKDPEYINVLKQSGYKIYPIGDINSTSILEVEMDALETTTSIPVESPKPIVRRFNQLKKLVNKKLLITITSIAIVVAVILGIVLVASSIKNNKIIESFNSVEELKTAIKNDPHKYDGKRVSVKAYVWKLYTVVYLLDNLPASGELWDDRARIKVYITDNKKLTVLEHGDYINLEGVITFSYDGEIYMTDCTYSFTGKK